MNVRSSLSSPTASSLRCESEENPVPKSSIETKMPESARLSMTRLDRVKSAITIPSVISRTSAPGRQPRPCQDLADALGQRGVQEVGGEQVDGDRSSIPVVPPLSAVSHCLLENPRSQGMDESALLRERQEVFGGNKPEGGMGPAQECLDRDHLSGSQVNLGLIVQRQRAVDHCHPEVFDQREPVGLVVECDLVDLERAAFILGSVHGGVRAVDQLGSAQGVVWSKGDADACTDVQAGGVARRSVQ